MTHKKEATQEATVIAGILNKQATGNGNVIFSKVGGGVFRNVSHWSKTPPIRIKLSSANEKRKLETNIHGLLAR